MTEIPIRSVVKTPNGQGIVQGWLRVPGCPPKLLVLHGLYSRRRERSRRAGIWNLQAYLPEQVQLAEAQ